MRRQRTRLPNGVSMEQDIREHSAMMGRQMRKNAAAPCRLQSQVVVPGYMLSLSWMYRVRRRMVMMTVVRQNRIVPRNLPR